MIHYVRENILNKQVNNTYTRKNGGCVIYAKLAANIFSQIKNNEMFSFGRKVWLTLLMLLKLPYYLFIKSLLCFFWKKEILKGKFNAVNGKVKSSNVKKTTKFYFIGIPFFIWFSKPNQNDWEKLLK